MLRAVQRLLTMALRADDSPAALADLARRANDLSDEERAWLTRLDADGLRLTGLLLKKLRFERLTRGHREAAALFAERPGEFMRLFTAYDGAVPPTAYFSAEEADLFQSWRAANPPG